MQKKQFYRFVIPSIGAMLVTGLYFVVDGIFVGRGVGIGGLAAVNIAVPFVSILVAVSMMLTMGGAAITSIFFGKGEREKGNNTFNTTMCMILIFASFMTIMSVLMPEGIAKLFGANDLLLSDTADYIRYYVTFGIFFCSAMALSAFVRNDGNPKLAFWGMIVGAVSNIFLDWLFIFPLQMGVMGAAIASGLGQLFSCLVLSTHFIRKKGVLRFSIPIKETGLVLHIIKTGTPEFVTQMSQPVIILCYNFIILRTFGEMGISAFSVISYLLMVIVGLFIGLAQGIQPLISRSRGEGNLEMEQYFLKKGLSLSILLSVIVYGIMLLFGKNIISIFNTDPELIQLAYACITVYGICFIFAAVNMVYTTYYLAIKMTRPALIIAILRSFIVNVICIFLLPAIFGDSAIWIGIVVAEFIVMIVTLFIEKQKLYQQKCAV